jgi:hypothetical protein
MVKLKEILTEVEPFLCGEESVIGKVRGYTEGCRVRMINKIKRSYWKFVCPGEMGGGVKGVVGECSSDLMVADGFYSQCYLEVSKYIYISHFF